MRLKKNSVSIHLNKAKVDAFIQKNGLQELYESDCNDWRLYPMSLQPDGTYKRVVIPEAIPVCKYIH